MKGVGHTYRPEVGEICLISEPHCDDEDGYVYGEFEVLWKDDDFLLYRKEGCWPNIAKWDHVIAKPL